MTKILLLTFASLILIQISETAVAGCQDPLIRDFCQQYGACLQLTAFGNYCKSCGFCNVSETAFLRSSNNEIDFLQHSSFPGTRLSATSRSECKDIMLRKFCQKYGGCFQISGQNHFGDHFFRNFCQSCGFCEGMDDEICKVLDLDNCKALSIQKKCPQMCSKSTDEAFCENLDLENCEEPVINKRCSQRCSISIPANSTRAKPISECRDERKGHYCSDNKRHCHTDDKYIKMKDYCKKTCGFCEDNGGEFPLKKAYPGKFWTRTECPPMHFKGYYTPVSLEVASLELCFKECRKHVECTAVGYQKKNPSKCNLVKCPNPPPEPSGTDRKWDYYYLGSAFCGDPECWPEITAVGLGRPYCITDNFACPHGDLGCKCQYGGHCCSPINQNHEKCGVIQDPCWRAARRSNSAVASARNAEECSKIFPKGSYFMASTNKYYHSEIKGCGCCIDKSESTLIDTFKCGINPLKDFTRIINGHQVNDANKHPWMVQLFKDEYKKEAYFCGGSLINFRFILTAAHCFYDRKNHCKEDKPNIVFAGIGGNKLLGPKAIRIPRGNIMVLDIYDCKTKDKDAALLKLPESVLNDYLIDGDKVPICLANDDKYTFSGLNATIIGYGYTIEPPEWVWFYDPTEVQEFLGEAFVPIMNLAECAYKSKGRNTENMICTWTGKGAEHGDSDFCDGDSGGPLLIGGVAYNTDQLQQIGIMSRASCGRPRQRGVYTRITKIIKDINKIAGHIYTIFSVTNGK